MQIMVVENHPDTLLYMRMYLEASGYIVRSAMTMEQALTQLAAASCDVLISDIGLPDGDGWELIQRAHLSPSVYTIAMSGFGTHADVIRSQQAGYRQHLLKPFTPDQLDEFLAVAERERDQRR